MNTKVCPKSHAISKNLEPVFAFPDDTNRKSKFTEGREAKSLVLVRDENNPKIWVYYKKYWLIDVKTWKEIF